MITQPYQGGAGFINPTPGWLKELERWTKERGLLLIIDEVQSAFGRTGKLLAVEWEDVSLLASLPATFEAHQLKFAPLQELVARINDADGLVVNMVKITREVIQNLRSCRLIIRHGVGYDNVDVPAATEHGIQVCYVPDDCLISYCLSGSRHRFPLLTIRQMVDTLCGMDCTRCIRLFAA